MSRATKCGGRSPRRLTALLVLMTVVGCGGYDQASPLTHDYALALYSICNRQAADKLPEVSSQIEADREAGKLSSREANWLLTIIATAERGDWEPAMQDARELMQAEVDGAR